MGVKPRQIGGIGWAADGSDNDRYGPTVPAKLAGGRGWRTDAEQYCCCQYRIQRRIDQWGRSKKVNLLLSKFYFNKFLQYYA